MGDLIWLPILLLPLLGIISVIMRSRSPGGQEVLRRQRRYGRNNAVLGIVLAVLVIFFGYRTYR